MYKLLWATHLNCRKSGTYVPFCFQFAIVFRRQANNVFFVFVCGFSVLMFSPFFAHLKTFRFFLLIEASFDGVPITLDLMNAFISVSPVVLKFNI